MGGSLFIGNLRDKRRENRAEDGGHDAGDGDGQAAHGAFDFAHLEGFAGADGVGCGADADAPGDGVGDVADLADHLGHEGTQDAGEDDEPDHYWYYFQANGRAMTNGNNDKVALKTINGKKSEKKFLWTPCAAFPDSFGNVTR